MLRTFLLASTALLLPALAIADPVVPPIQAQATAVATTTVITPTGGGGSIAIPAGMPPPIHQMSPSASLNAKEKASANQAAAWRNRNDKPVRGPDGVQRWVFGASLPSVVCAALQVCDVALEPGEIVNVIHVADSVRWQVLPVVGGEQTTHLVIKPTDAGLITSMLVYTDRRTYSIKLVSTQSQWTPLTAFSYPETAQAAWADYGARMTASKPTAQSGGSYGGSVDLDFNYSVSGDAPWKPLRVYSLGGKTYVQFPENMKYGSAPALIGLTNDGGWFSSPSEQMLRYRISGDKYVVDGLIEHAKLVIGVGSAQTKVDIKHGGR